MKRYFVYLSYDGTGYHGWQIQPNGNSVQQELERGLSTLLRREVHVTGAGRTDAGVHARVMVAHFDVDESLDGGQLVYKLNRILPRDISVGRVVSVDNGLHARFSAASRTYHYYIHRCKSPFLRHYSCELRYDLDFELMNEAAKRLLSVEDFGAFCKAGSDVKTTVCHVTEACWIPLTQVSAGHLRTAFTAVHPTEWCFIITANRFLRNMVRAVVGTLIEVGRHSISIEEFERIIAGRKRSDAGESMPAHALFLWNVEY